MSRFLYIIECSSTPAFFIYVSLSKPEPALLLECSAFHPYLNVVKVIEKINAQDVYCADKYVKIYMEHFGWDNVRGGSYSEEVLPDYKIKALQNEFTYRETIKFNADPKSVVYERIQNSHTKCPATLLREQERYRETKALYDKCILQHSNVSNSYDYVGWLTDFVDYSCHDDGPLAVSKEAIQVYRESLICLKHISQTFFMLRDLRLDGEDTFEPRIFLCKPEFVLDTLFYHRKSITNWSNVRESSTKLIHRFEYMRNYVKNRMDEFEFDIASYPAFPELYYEMALRVFTDDGFTR